MRGGRWLVLCGLSVLYRCTEPGRPPSENGCTYAADCAEGESCLEGRCLPLSKQTTRECSSNAQCPTGPVDAGVTTDAGMTASGCRIDFDCAPPQSICIEGGQCAPGCLATGCSARDICNDDTGRCEPESVGQTCAADGECAPPSTICISGQCKTGCTMTGGLACATLEICSSETGRCNPSPSCVTDSECPAAAR